MTPHRQPQPPPDADAADRTDSDSRRLAREARLRALGFDELTPRQRRANLALNIALREWPK